MNNEKIDFQKYYSPSMALRGYGGADRKISILLDGKQYMLKFPGQFTESKKNEMNSSMSNNTISEHIGCRIFEAIGIPVQNTILGTFDKQIVVACEDFTEDGFVLNEFNKYQNYAGALSIISDDVARVPKLEQLEKIFSELPQLESIRHSAVERYWDTFIVDAFIGNFDRHSGNWGYLVNSDKGLIKLAPVYDCGSSLYPRMGDFGAKQILQDSKKIEERIFCFPNAALQINGKKVGYYDFIANANYEECDKALIRIVPKINMDTVYNIISTTMYMSDIRKEFLIKMLDNRYRIILKEVYDKKKTIINEQKVKKSIVHR